MKKILILIGLIFISNNACAIEVNYEEIERVFHKFDAKCSGNDSGWMDFYDMADFDHKQEQNRMFKHDAEKQCAQGRTYPRNPKKIVEVFREVVAENRSCTDEMSKSELRLIEQAIYDKNNLGVQASFYGPENDNSEACSYYHIQIYRHDATLVRIVIDYTD